MRFLRIFQRDHQRYEGVRPINIHLLRILFVLVVAFVGTDTWSALLTHEGPWDHLRAAAICMLAAYSAMSIVGIFHPLRMLPIVFFEIFYKLIWLAVVAYPLWSAGRLAGSPAEGMTKAFLWVVLPIVAMPWRYFLNTYVVNRRAA